MASTKEALRYLYGKDTDSDNRNKGIVKTSIIGILANVLLAGFKAVIGLATNSIAITMDAVNNISDAGSSLITIIGTRLAGRPADKKHPFGFGRIEYLSAMIISVIVLYAGITSFTESVKKIIHPETPDYTAVSLIIVAVGVLVKIVLGNYVKKQGKKYNSDSLVNSGEDAALDSVISASTLAAAFIYIFFHISLESWLGAVISLIIIKSGVEMLKDTISQLLGEAGDADLARNIKKTVMSHPEVSGAYDLVLNNYGPDAYNASIHIEVQDTLDMDALDELIRKITMEVYVQYHVILTAVGIYAVNTKDQAIIQMRNTIQECVMKNPYVLQMHGFAVNKKDKSIRFDLVISFDTKDRFESFQNTVDEVQKLYPDYRIEAVMDTDFTEQ